MSGFAPSKCEMSGLQSDSLQIESQFEPQGQQRSTASARPGAAGHARRAPDPREACSARAPGAGVLRGLSQSVRTCSQCTATTSTGTRCRKRTCRGPVCWQHAPRRSNMDCVSNRRKFKTQGLVYMQRNDLPKMRALHRTRESCAHVIKSDRSTEQTRVSTFYVAPMQSVSTPLPRAKSMAPGICRTQERV
eukprot:COSAG03_NODE_593_length_6822_cov_2.810650_1_plen_191_part_00